MCDFRQQIVKSLIIVLAWSCSAGAFSVSSASTSRGAQGSSLNALDPSIINAAAATYLPSVGVALASAAAGAATQMPRIQALEAELQSAKEALDATQQEMEAKLDELEDRLFSMDAEFEAQTARFQRKYDQEKKKELEKLTAKLKQDMEFSLQIRLEEEKSRLLTQQQARMLQNDSETVGQLSTLRLQQTSLLESNEQLESALDAAQAELENLRREASDFSQGNKFLNLFRRP